MPGKAALWKVATVEERRDMVMDILEPRGLHYDVEQQEIAAITPHPAFLPILRMLEGVMEYKEATGMLVTSRWQQRNRRATNRRSHLALIPIGKLFSGRGDILVYTPKSSSEYIQSDDLSEQALENPGDIPLSQRRPGPDAPPWKIPVSEWSNVVRRVVENQEPLCKLAVDYGVSHETVRRVINAAQKRTS